ncbi:GrpB family protein [Bacillus sp. CRN 9]|nr:GrpB family protein [Bacillus sp. CRN 9]
MKLGLKRDEVRLESHTVEWEKEFHKVKQDILNSTPIQEKQIEHIGSTAIKDMIAKPILDIVVGVDDIENVEKIIFEGLKKVGFLKLQVQRPNEIVHAKFTDDSYEEKTHFIHLVEYNKDLWKNLIFFRDYLNASLLQKYEQHRENAALWEKLSPKTKNQTKGIVGFKVKVQEVQAAFKLSQNRNEEDYINIIDKLNKEKYSNSRQFSVTYAPLLDNGGFYRGSQARSTFRVILSLPTNWDLLFGHFIFV